MDDATLSELQAALAASPDNLRLRLVLARALSDRSRGAEAAALLSQAGSPDWPSAGDRRFAARVLIGAGQAAAALDLAAGDDPEDLLLRARACLALDRLDEGRAAYDRAVAANPALEDPDLRTRLGARVRSFAAGADERRLRVIERGPTDGAALDPLLAPETARITFADVGGLGEIKAQIERRIILPFRKPSLFQRFRRQAGGGILLYGPPGCGKTLLARATAGECGARFLNVAISDVLDMYIGESEAKLHAIFEKARVSVPSVLFFDEIDALGGKRQFARESATAKLVSQFLTEMDGFSGANQGVLVLGATNVPWAVDPAFRRPGRFDRLLFVPPPDRPARATILGLLLAGRPAEDGLDLDALAQRTAGFSGADLRNLVETAADRAIEQSIAEGRELPISDRLLGQALGEVKPTTHEWLTTARNYARYANEGGQYDEVLAFLDRHTRTAR